MRSTFFLSLLAVLGSVRAYSHENFGTTLSGDGDYFFTNVATGEVLSVYRTGVMNVSPVSSESATSLSVQFDGETARLSGPSNQCISAQRSSDSNQADAAVTKNCAVGKGLLTGSESTDKSAQWWYLVPSGSTASVSRPHSSSSNWRQSLIFGDSAPQTSFQSNDCEHDGPWLSAHPGYVNIHTECLEELKAYEKTLTRMAKRTRLAHAQMAAMTMGKTEREEPSYFIVSSDEQGRMAISGSSVETFGGSISTELKSWDKNGNDLKQLWTISEA